MPADVIILPFHSRSVFNILNLDRYLSQQLGGVAMCNLTVAVINSADGHISSFNVLALLYYEEKPPALWTSYPKQKNIEIL